MGCQICGRVPRMFECFGGGYWQELLGDRWVCPSCYFWACRILKITPALRKPWL